MNDIFVCRGHVNNVCVRAQCQAIACSHARVFLYLQPAFGAAHASQPTVSDVSNMSHDRSMLPGPQCGRASCLCPNHIHCKSLCMLLITPRACCHEPGHARSTSRDDQYLCEHVHAAGSAGWLHPRECLLHWMTGEHLYAHEEISNGLMHRTAAGRLGVKLQPL
eukprot:356791-Chlamydomonas_euryale.AAC.6